MVDNKYITNNYKLFQNRNIWPIIKNPEMIRFVPDHLKTKNMCNHAVKTLPFITRHVPHQYKSQQMCDKDVLENCGT